MVHQLQLPDWSVLVGLTAFLVTFSVFAAFVIHTVRMPRRKIEQLENLPWADDPKP